MAESILSKSGKGKFQAFSAGSHPSSQIHPYSIDLLKNLGYETSQLRSKSWDEFAGADAAKMDFVFTVCDDAAKEVCPMWPGQPMTAHWGVPDPSAAEGKEAEKRLAFANTYRMLQRRIDVFISLPVKSLARLALQQEIDKIGRMVDSSEKTS
jgi:protein-tyrosine-phosphatase